MTLDLAHIMYFADSNGNIKERQQRKHLELIDGIIGGEGNGPLSPIPVESKTLIFSDNIVCGDFTAAQLMGYNPEKISLIRYAMQDDRLSDLPTSGILECRINGKEINIYNLGPVLNRPFLPPVGWRRFLA